MIQNTISLLAVILVVFLNYWREVRTKQESEKYLKKQKFYEELVDYLNKALFQEDCSQGRNWTKLYNKSFIFASDEVVTQLNCFFTKINGRSEFPHSELKDTYAKILLACRRDLGIGNKIVCVTSYQAPFEQ
ncbi:MAG: hypothetical protein ISS77_07520 [Phycisphaerae bacterium]|nr:hypothetical protein [Phycisphaerae bacterium]